MSVTSPHSNLIVNRRVEAKIERQARLAGHCLFIVHCGLFSQRRKAWIYAAAAHLDPQIWSQLRHPDPDGRADDFKWLQTKLSLLVRSLSCHEAPCSGGIEGSSWPFILCKPLTEPPSAHLIPNIDETKWRRKSVGQNCLCCSLCGATLADGSSGRIQLPKDFVISWIPHRYCCTSSYVSLSLPSIRDIIRISLTSLQATATQVVLLPPSSVATDPVPQTPGWKIPLFLCSLTFHHAVLPYVHITSICHLLASMNCALFCPHPSNEGLCWN